MIYITGDINLTDNAFDVGFGVGSNIINKGLQPFGDINKEKGDYWIGNCEGVISDISDCTGYHKDSFRLGLAGFNKLNNIIDYYGVANNHVMNHGADAYNQMTDFLEKKCQGIFGSKEKKSVLFSHQGKNVGITGFSLRNDHMKWKPLYWNFPEIAEIPSELKKIRNADFCIAYIHWGVEYVNHPTIEQIRLAHYLIDEGYDLVVGMHPHVLQGYEIYKGKHIFYSLGNFVFNMAWSPTSIGAVIKLDVVTGDVSFEYVKIDKNYCPCLIDKTEVPIEWRFESLNAVLDQKQNPEVYAKEFVAGLKKYRRENYKHFIKQMWHFDKKILVSVLSDFVKRRLKMK